jgi:two-component system nitrogen regulation response regulator NtrX
MPDALVESALFGYEKGSFAGAISMRHGKLELAQNGTVFLDEIGDLEANSQAKLARALQSGEFTRVGGRQNIRITARVISATCRDLSIRLGQSGFREDLFTCVSGVQIGIPALRDRPEDIAPMARYFLEDFWVRSGCGAKSFEPAAWRALEDYAWPGNARQLRNVVEHMAIRSHDDRLHAADIPPELKPRPKAGARYTIQ